MPRPVRRTDYDNAKSWLTTARANPNPLSFQTATGAVDGDNDEFVFTGPPIFVVYQGVVQLKNTDYTLSGSTATFTVPPISGVVQGLV